MCFPRIIQFLSISKTLRKGMKYFKKIETNVAYKILSL